MDFYRILGWIIFSLAVFNASLFVIRQILKRTKWKKLRPVNKVFTKFHIVTGLLLVIIAPIHGFIALGNNLYWHTGLLAYLFVLGILATFVLGKTVKKMKMSWRIFHRLVDAFAWVVIIIHLVNPWLFI